MEGRARAFGRSLVSWGCQSFVSYLERSEDVDKVDGRARAFSGEVLGLVGCLGLGSFLRSTGMPKKVYDVLGEVLGLIILSGVGRSYLKRARMSTKWRRGRRHSRGRSLWLGDLI